MFQIHFVLIHYFLNVIAGNFRCRLHWKLSEKVFLQFVNCSALSVQNELSAGALSCNPTNHGAHFRFVLPDCRLCLLSRIPSGVKFLFFVQQVNSFFFYADHFILRQESGFALRVILKLEFVLAFVYSMVVLRRDCFSRHSYFQKAMSILASLEL